MSARINLAVLVPLYTAEPNPRGIWTKKWAVGVIVRARLDARNATGHGNAAKRRVERLRAQFEAEADAATREWFDDRERELSADDVDAMAQADAKKRRAVARRYVAADNPPVFLP